MDIDLNDCKPRYGLSKLRLDNDAISRFAKRVQNTWEVTAPS